MTTPNKKAKHFKTLRPNRKTVLMDQTAIRHCYDAHQQSKTSKCWHNYRAGRSHSTDVLNGNDLACSPLIKTMKPPSWNLSEP